MNDIKQNEMDDITLAMNQLGIKATPNVLYLCLNYE